MKLRQFVAATSLLLLGWLALAFQYRAAVPLAKVVEVAAEVPVLPAVEPAEVDDLAVSDSP